MTIPHTDAVKLAQELLAREAKLTPNDEPVSFANEGEDLERWNFTRRMAADVMFTMTNVHKLARYVLATKAPRLDEIEERAVKRVGALIYDAPRGPVDPTWVHSLLAIIDRLTEAAPSAAPEVFEIDPDFKDASAFRPVEPARVTEERHDADCLYWTDGPCICDRTEPSHGLPGETK